MVSEGPCRCPQVPVLSHAAGQGAGVRHCPGAAVCSARGGFYGRGWSGAEGGRPWPGTLPGDTNTGGPASQTPAALTCPGDGMWAPRRWGEEERQLTNYFGGPPGFALGVIRWGQKHVPADF